MEETNLIGLGTAALGRPQYINIRKEDTLPEFSLAQFKNRAVQVLEKAYAKGIRYFDTAPGYGMAEQILLDWVKTKEDAKLEVATKWGYTYVANFDPLAVVHEIKEHSLTKLNEQWKKSKQLLPQLSTYQIHSATLETGVLENKDVIERLGLIKKQHNIRMGLTTTGVNQVEIVKRALQVQFEGAPLFDAFQCTYNILDQSLSIIAPELLAQGRKIIVKEAVANGRIIPSTRFSHYKPMYKTLEGLAMKFGVGSDAIALRFCMQSISPTWVLSGAASVEHIEANLLANGFELSEEELAELSKHKTKPHDYWAERDALSWN